MQVVAADELTIHADPRARWVPECLHPVLTEIATGRWQIRHSRGRLRDVPCCMGCGRQIRIREGDEQPVDGWVCLACRELMAARLEKIRKRERAARRGVAE